jgi:hypothetical protein
MTVTIITAEMMAATIAAEITAIITAAFITTETTVAEISGVKMGQGDLNTMTEERHACLTK